MIGNQLDGMALRGAWCPTGQMAIFYTKPSVDPDDLEKNANEAECVGREFRGIRMTWKRMPMKPSALVENSEGSG